ncbi:hypothetical protein chiPu_0026897 [Chiloscyllium punctatum]|uniref:Shisa N-terminal domain-containing protein n=1 Tax=Chiloscyllium punctatum TaxID=137246 RepID=A0A401TK11_CHIPU|nr:hypothetical protein [Chiloscyllium punctatum]
MPRNGHRAALALLLLWALSQPGACTSWNGSRGAERREGPVGDSCRGYYDVMGHWDPPFNCSAGTYLFCCGTCHYRFCCEFPSYQLAQASCTNYDSPGWANPAPGGTPAAEADPYDPAADRTNSTVYIVCGLLALGLGAGIAARVACRKSGQQPRELNVSR